MTANKKWFVLLLEVDDFYQSMKILTEFKKDMNDLGRVTVIEIEETNYDFLYNSLIEKANRGFNHA